MIPSTDIVAALRGRMSIDPATLLTESQKTCLRQVARGMSSKEIARENGLSPHTVDTYIKQAMAALGVSNRREAARMLTRAAPSQKLGSLSQAVAEPEYSSNLAAPPRPRSMRLIDLPRVGGEINDLSWTDRNYSIFKVAAFGVSVILAIILITAGILWVFE
ncbi:helix-turn-helix transcriptional regulator [Parasphingopyxis algicola]|nr:helix-turn-helix transcriptional regulator [Parasphingopyxis algicola]